MQALTIPAPQKANRQDAKCTLAVLHAICDLNGSTEYAYFISPCAHEMGAVRGIPKGFRPFGRGCRGTASPCLLVPQNYFNSP